MEYTEKKLAKDLMPKDEYWSENDFNKILTIEQSALNPNDLSIETENFLEAIGKDEIVLVRVPSSPVMSFEEFKAKHLSEFTNRYTIEFAERFVKTKYEGYLIGTRGIVPEMTDEEIEKEMNRQDFEAAEAGMGRWINVYDYTNEEDFLMGAEMYRNWLRSQINK